MLRGMQPRPYCRAGAIVGRKKKKNGAETALPREHIFKCWVEIRNLNDGATRTLPLSVLTVIALVPREREAQYPNKQVLRLKDDAVTLEAENLEDLANQLRERYPDGAYERTIHCQRDLGAEERRANALNGLTDMLVKAVVDDLLREVGRSERRAKDKF
jgi:hypothetical protein